MTLSFLKAKTVVVTGAAGFLGSHLTERLLAEGARVIGVDNFLTGSRDNVTHLLSNDRFALIEGDVCEIPERYLPEDLEIDLVFHFASPASPPVYQAHPVETYLVNSLGTHQLLQYLLEQHPAARFVYASTSESYGDPEIHPQVESYWGRVNPNGVRSCYDESKRLGEAICGVHARDFELDVRIVRIFNTYGPRMDPRDGRVIPNFVTQALRSEKLTIYGEGSQTRSYCYVDDLIEGILRLSCVESAAGETVNIGNPDEYTILETAKIIRDLIDPTLEFDKRPLPKDDPTRRCPDITKAKTLLGWMPTVKFQDGLTKTVEYFRQIAQE